MDNDTHRNPQTTAVPSLCVLDLFLRDARPEVVDLRVASSPLKDGIYRSTAKAEFAEQGHLDDRLQLDEEQEECRSSCRLLL